MVIWVWDMLSLSYVCKIQKVQVGSWKHSREVKLGVCLVSFEFQGKHSDEITEKLPS